MAAVITKKKGKNCLDDSLLLAISRGEICEPSLSQFLEHLDGCLACCERSMELLSLQPDPLDQLMKSAFHSMTHGNETSPPDRKEESKPAGQKKECSSSKSASNGHSSSCLLHPMELAPEQQPSWLGNFRNKAARLSSPPFSPNPEPGTSNQFGKYRIEWVLGEGASSVVYRALDLELERQVALKVLRPDVAEDPANAECFLREAQALARVRSPHVVRLISYGRNPSPYLTMDLLEGKTLAKELENGPLEPGRAVAIVRDIAYGLQAIHQSDLVHRDLKPGNIWLHNGPDGERAILMDLGLVAAANPRMGTPGYIAPEILKNVRPGPPADIFSLGVVLRAMALGGHPDSHTGEKAPGNLASLISLMMHPTPGARPTARDVIDITCDWFGKKKRSYSGLKTIAASFACALGLTSGLFFVNWQKPAPVEQSNQKLPTALSPFIFLESAFSPDIALHQSRFGVSRAGFLVLHKDALYRRDPQQNQWEEFQLPFKVDESAMEGDKLAISSTKGIIKLFDVGQWPPAEIASFTPHGNDGLDWMCLSLSQDGSGKLLGIRANTIFVAEPKEGVYPTELTSRQSTLSLTKGNRAPIGVILDQNGHGVFSVMPLGAVSLSTMEIENCVLWQIKPSNAGPSSIALRPGTPGSLAIASPDGFLGLFGPDLVMDKRGLTLPQTLWSRKFPSPILQPSFASENHLAFITTQGPYPVKVLDVKNPVDSTNCLSCANPVALATEPKAGLLHCLDAEGNILTWDMNFLKPCCDCFQSVPVKKE